MDRLKAMFTNAQTVLSKAGQAFMLPIALLPAAGLFLGIGESFTNPVFIEQFPNLAMLQEGGWLYNVLSVMAVAGNIVFANLPLLFAVGLAVGLAKKEKGSAALAAIIGYFVMLVVASKVLQIIEYNPNILGIPFLESGLNDQTAEWISAQINSVYGIEATMTPQQMMEFQNYTAATLPEVISLTTVDNNVVEVAAAPLFDILQEQPDLVGNQITMLHQNGALTDTLGIGNTLSMGVFGAIMSGLLTVYLHNKFLEAKLPDILSFFSGPRLIPILAATFGIFLGVICAFFWPIIGTGLSMLGEWITSIGSVGSLLFGLIERALIPFGLHHVFYTPLWQTAVGGEAVVDGVTLYGTQNIFFGHLGAGTLGEYTSTNYMSGKYPFMMFGLPGVALAMYTCAKTKNRKVISGQLFSVALTAMLTGITEPIEFTFLFLAPILYYGIHVPLAGLSFFLMDILNVKIGMTFSGGLIDYTMFGLIPQFTGQNVNALNVILVGIPYFFVYYILFTAAIKYFNVPTPGRGEDLELKTKADFKAKQAQTTSNSNGLTEQQEMILEALGGADNIKDVGACITRLRVTVNDASKVKDQDHWINVLGAKGLVINGNGIQAIYGAEAKDHSNALADFLGLD